MIRIFILWSLQVSVDIKKRKKKKRHFLFHESISKYHLIEKYD